jgi:hypothetical protein
MIRIGLLTGLLSVAVLCSPQNRCQAGDGPTRSYIYLTRDVVPEGSAQMEVEELGYDDLVEQPVFSEPVIAHRGRVARRAVPRVVPTEALIEQGYAFPGPSDEYAPEVDYGTPLPTTLWGSRSIGRQTTLRPRPHCFTAPGYESACEEDLLGLPAYGSREVPCGRCRGKVRGCRCRLIKKPCPPVRTAAARRRCPPRRPSPCLEDRPEFSADSPEFSGEWSPMTPISPSTGDDLLPPIQGSSGWRAPGTTSRSPAPVVRSRVIRSTAPTPRNVVPTGRGPAPVPRFEEVPWQSESELGPELSIP